MKMKKKGKKNPHPVICAAPEQLFPLAPNVAAWSSRDPQQHGSQLTVSPRNNKVLKADQMPRPENT